MYEFPKRVEQHILESKSIAIFLYHMKDFGIIRDMRQSDYGVDLEYEFVQRDDDTKMANVIGKIIKIQLKSRKNVTKEKEGYYAKRIKQSTLNYWAELSFRTNVIVVLVDVTKEKLFFSLPVFWSATKQILNNGKNGKIRVFGSTHGKGNNIQKIFIDSLALAPTTKEIILYYKIAMLNFYRFYQLLYQAYYDDQCNDFFDSNEKIDSFKFLLECLHILCWLRLPEASNKYKENRSIEYYTEGTPNHRAWNCDFQVIIQNLIWDLVKELMKIRKNILDSFIFWIVRDKEIDKEILEFAYKYDLSLIIDPTKERTFLQFSDQTSYIRNDFSMYIDKKIAEAQARDTHHA